MPISPYLKMLRDHVGHAQLIAPAAAMIPVRNGQALLARNADTGEWQTLGGMIEPLEQPADAAMREAFEEAGVRAEPVRLIGVFAGPEAEVTYPNGDVVAYTVLAFAGRLIEAGAPFASDGAEIAEFTPDGEEIAEVAWFDADAIERLEMMRFNRRMALAALTPDAPTYFEPGKWRP
ncbi:MAG: NUDIX domain-containing protein [Neomegalonema sp.]|nr:NUDIX domain-containing protein [Neomegalonema sp.]